MKQIVLLRGVNIGGRTVKSDELKACFAKAGFKNPKTVLATGNVIIESNENTKKLKTQIEHFLLSDFQFPILVLVVSIEDFKEILVNYPFTNLSEEFHRYVIFKDRKATITEMQLDENIEGIKSGGNVLYWYVLKGHTLDSNFAKQMAKTAKAEFSTTRNLNTLNRIIEAAND